MKIKPRYFQNEKNQINRLWKIYNDKNNELMQIASIIDSTIGSTSK